MRCTAPSDRDLKLLHTVDTCGYAPETAGRALGISGREAQQRLGEVKQFLGLHGASRLWNVQPDLAEYVALQHASERLTFLEREVVQAWRSSIGMRSTTRTCGAKTVTVSRQSFGDPKFLTAAMKLSREQVRLAQDIARAYGELSAAGKFPQFDEPVEIEPAADPELSLEEQVQQTREQLVRLYETAQVLEAQLAKQNGTPNPCAPGGAEPAAAAPIEGEELDATAYEEEGYDDAIDREPPPRAQKFAAPNPVRATVNPREEQQRAAVLAQVAGRNKPAHRPR